MLLRHSSLSRQARALSCRADSSSGTAAPAPAPAPARQRSQQQQQELDDTASARFPLLNARTRTKEVRARVCAEVLAGGLIFVAGGDLQLRNGTDVYYKFRAASDFLYMSGVNEPGCGCLLDPETQRFTLVAPKPEPDAELWTGGLPSLDELAEAAGADAAIYAHDLPAYVQQQHPGLETLHVLEADLPSSHHQQQGQENQQAAALHALRAAQPNLALSTAFLQGLLHRCRALKTPGEVGCLLQASKASAAAHKAVWTACSPGVYEYQLEAAFVQACLHDGNRQLGYPCIVGAGRDAAVLHYERNTAKVSEGDLVLVDAGAEHEGYTADITRTFPASGRFSHAQRDIYDLTLGLQQHALNQLRPGVSWAEVQASTRLLMLEHLQQLGLVASGSTEGLMEAGVDKLFMPHGLGHFLGLDVHDVSAGGPVPTHLQDGHVITVEPGIYFMPTLLARAKADAKQAAGVVWPAVEELMGLGGVRVEDNAAITADGHVNLTMAAGMPKDAREIEEFMAAAAGRRK